MARRSIATAFLLLVVGLLAGCQTPIVDETGPLSIRQVAVTTNPEVKSATPVGPAIQSAASATVIRDTAGGLPANVRISIDRVTYKNPVLSLLVGSANSISTTVSITDESGRQVARFPHAVVANGAINGIIGATMAAMQDPVAVDQAMTTQYATELRDHIYGKPGHKPKKSAAKAPPASAPAPQPTSKTIPKPEAKPVAPTS